MNDGCFPLDSLYDVEMASNALIVPFILGSTLTIHALTWPPQAFKCTLAMTCCSGVTFASWAVEPRPYDSRSGPTQDVPKCAVESHPPPG